MLGALVYGDSEILIETAFETFQVRVDRFVSEPPTATELEAGRRLALELRFGLGFLDPTLVLGAQRLYHALFEVGPFRPRRADASAASFHAIQRLAEILEGELEAGRLVVVTGRGIANLPEQELTVRRPPVEAQRPALSPSRARQGPLQTDFEVRFVDEIGQGISSLDIRIDAGDRSEQRTTNAAGVATLEGTTAGSGTATVLDPDSLSNILEPRWARQRFGSAPAGANTTRVAFDGGALDATNIKAGTPNTVVIAPVLGKIFMQLFDKTGRVQHAKRQYSISGPTSLSGTTDESARLLHENVPPGDYELTLLVDDDQYVSPAEVIDSADGEPQIRLLGAAPFSAFARLRGLVFETNKSFVLPGAIPGFVKLRNVCLENNPSDLLVVGHTDTTAEPAINDPLSLERAECSGAYLSDDVDTWLGKYGQGTLAKRRWGSHEDQLMLEAMPDFGTKPLAEDPVRWFQRTRGLTLDGMAGPEVRQQLIAEYMALDGPPFAELSNLEIDITIHGCGENFPLDESGDELDSQPVDSKEDQTDRRAEFFFFNAEFGIQPAPPGSNSPKGSTEYPEWRKKSLLLHDFESDHIQGLIVEWSNDLDPQMPADLSLSATQDGTTQSLQWAEGSVDAASGYRQFVFSQILGNDTVTLQAASNELAVTLVLWQDQVINDPETPPVWQHWLEELVDTGQPDGTLTAEGDVPAVSDAQSRPEDFSTFFDI